MQLVADEEMAPDEEDASSDDDESCSPCEQKQNKQLDQSSERGLNKLSLFENFDYNRYKDGKILP